MKLKVYRHSFVAHLRSKIDENVKQYLSGDFGWTLDVENGNNIREIDAPWWNEKPILKLNSVFSGDNDVDDARDARIVYEALRDLPLELAKDDRLWSTLCHVYFLPYIRARNHKYLFTQESDERKRVIVTRFFLTDTGRGAERTNSISRLWWYGHLVAQSAKLLDVDYEKALLHQLKDTDFRANTLERPEVMSSKKIRAAVLNNAISRNQVGDHFWSSHNNRPYRPVMSQITERAARIFFPGIDQASLNQLVDDLVKKQKQPDEAT